MPPSCQTAGVLSARSQPAGGPGALSARRRPAEAAARAALAAAAAVSVATTAGIVATLAVETAAFFRQVPLGEFLGSTRWSPLIEPRAYGIWPLVAGTAWVTAISAAVGVPLGLSAALYLSEYAPAAWRRRLKPTLELLAGIPTVVLGYFALNVLSREVIRRLLPDADFFNALSAGVAVGIMIVPIVASVAEDAISAVPSLLREGAYALGASRMTVAVRVVLPAAASGIMAAVVLGLSRAVGETMIVAIAAGSTPVLTASPLRSIQTLTGYIVQVSMGDTPQTSVEFKGIFAVGSTLFLLTLGLNVASQRLSRRLRQRL